CPRCGDYQPEMVECLQRERFRWLLRYHSGLLYFRAMALTGALFFAFATLVNAGRQTTDNILWGVTLTFGSAATAAGSLAVWAGLPRAYARWTAAYDPNDPRRRATRLAEARRLTELGEPGVTGDEYSPDREPLRPWQWGVRQMPDGSAGLDRGRPLSG